MNLPGRWKHTLLVLLEIALVLAILAILTAIWLPALVGPHSNPPGR